MNSLGPIALLVLGAAYVALSYGPPIVGCDIKGNVSSHGERIYHVPGQEYYGVTRVQLLHGERWFCSEAGARDAGWRRAWR